MSETLGTIESIIESITTIDIDLIVMTSGSEERKIDMGQKIINYWRAIEGLADHLPYHGSTFWNTEMLLQLRIIIIAIKVNS